MKLWGICVLVGILTLQTIIFYEFNGIRKKSYTNGKVIFYIDEFVKSEVKLRVEVSYLKNRVDRLSRINAKQSIRLSMMKDDLTTTKNEFLNIQSDRFNELVNRIHDSNFTGNISKTVSAEGGKAKEEKK